jgi:hypothetical protein
MPSRKAYDIVATTGEYKDKDGATKKRYTNMGVVIEHEDGNLSLVMESIPVGWSGKANLYKPKPRGEASSAPAEAAAERPDSEIPF